MQRGEVNGTCGMFGSSINSQFGAEVKDGRMKLFIQMGSKRSNQFGKIPSVFDYAKTDEDRAILQFHFGQLLLGRPLAGPPGIPADRLAALRTALFATMKDPQFLAEADKAGLDIDPVSPEQVHALLKQFAAFLAGDPGQGARSDGALSPLSMLATGRQKLERMRDGRVVYIGAERVDDVTAHPAFRRGAADHRGALRPQGRSGQGASCSPTRRTASATRLQWLRCRTRDDLARRMRALRAERRRDLRLHRPLARAGRRA